MLTYRLQARTVVIDKLPEFPAEALVRMELEPKVPFGGLAGPSRTLPKGGKLTLTANRDRGTLISNLDEQLYPPLHFKYLFDEFDQLNSELSVHGNELTMKFMCSSLENLVSRIIVFENILPAFLTAFVPDAPYPSKIEGTLSGKSFYWLYDVNSFRENGIVATAKGQKENLCNSFGIMLASYGKTRLSMGFYYFYQGCRLLNVGRNRFEFAGEVVLNFTKALQSLFGDTKDQAREGLEKLGYSKDEIEGKFISLFELRSKFDSAHSSLKVLEIGDLDLIHDYVRNAENWMRELMKRIISHMKKRKGHSLPPDPSKTLSSEQRRVLRRLRENLEALDQN